MDAFSAVGYAALAYLIIGCFAALVLHVGALRRIDPATAGAGFFFRLLITPGLIALWPFLVAKAARGNHEPGPLESPLSARGIRRLHGLAVTALAVAIPLLVGAALGNRPPIEPIERAAVTWQFQRHPTNERVVIAKIPAPPVETPLLYFAAAERTAPVLLGVIAHIGEHRYTVSGDGDLRLYWPQSARWETVLHIGEPS